MRKTACKLLSIVLSVMILCTSGIVLFNQTDAQALETDKKILIPKIGVNDSLTVIEKMTNVNNVWGVNANSFENLTNNGIKVRWTWGTSQGVRIGVAKPFSLRNLKLNFNNFDKTTSSDNNGVFAIVLTNSSEKLKSVTATDWNLVLIVDTVNGELRVLNTNTVLLQSDKLKYGNIKGKAFSVAFSQGAGDDYNVELIVGNDKISGANVLTKEILGSVTYLNSTDSLYAEICTYKHTYKNKELLSAVSLEWNSVEYKDFHFSDVDPSLTFMSISNSKLSGSDKDAVKNTINVSWKSVISVSDMSSGGLRYDFTGASVNVREGYNSEVELDGLYLQFDDFSAKNPSAAKFALFLGNSTSLWGIEYKDNGSGALALVLDTDSGKIMAYPSGETVIQNDALKYKNISGKRFAYEFSKNSDGSYGLKVHIAGNSYDGTLTSSALKAVSGFTDEKNSSVILSCWGSNQTFSVNFIGIKNVNYIAEAAIAAIDAIGEVNDLSVKALINNAYKLYNRLSDFEKNRVTNFDKLLTAKAELDKLTKEANAQLTLIKIANSKLSGSDLEAVRNTINVGWSSMIKVSDISTGGLHYQFTNAVQNVREGYGENVSFDGLHLEFDEFSAINPEKAKMTVFVGDTPNYWGISSERSCLSLVLDTAKGEITAYPLGEKIIANDKLKYDNISGRRFSYEFSHSGNGADLTVTIDGSAVSGHISQSVFDEAVDFRDYGNCEFAVSCWDKGQSFSVDLIGLKQSKMTPSDIENLIDAIGFVTLDSETAIKKAETEYGKLTTVYQSYVANFDALIEAREYFDMLDFSGMILDAENAVDAIGEVDYKSGELIEQAAKAILRLNDAQLEKLKNYDTYESAVKKYYKLTGKMYNVESLANGFGKNSINGIYKSENQDKMSATVDESGIMKITFNNAERTVFNRGTRTFDLDGLYLRWGDLTKETDKNGTRLAVLLGGSSSYSPSTHMAFVFDTESGTLKLFPNNTVLLRDSILKHDNLKNKETSMKFTLMDEGVYCLELKIGDEIRYLPIPSSLTLDDKVNRTEKLYVALSPWVDNDAGETDGSQHTFSVNFLSVQCENKYAFEDFYDLIYDIEALPEEISESDIEGIEALYSTYLGNNLRLKKAVYNYGKLAETMNKIYRLKADDYTEWDDSTV